ncbi:hypothetical protein [Azonexus sp.]|nr:hypothetical protein [Azonexus sp.]
MDQFELGVLADFLGENWLAFVAFAEERDLDETQCEELSNKLDREAGRT